MKERVFTGRNSEFLDAIKRDMLMAKNIKIIVSFVMESGVKLLKETLQEVMRKGIQVEIITGTYLGITEPSALYLLKEILGKQGEIRIFEGDTSFHPKGYFIEKDQGKCVYVGSSNVSLTGLTKGVEWNYLIEDKVDATSVLAFEHHFNLLFQQDTKEASDAFLRDYAKNFKERKFIKEVKEKEQDGVQKIEPRGIQIEALFEMARAREEGIEKGLLVSATGTGKTYISAFDAQRFQPKRLLFLAHREEILTQALETFQTVHGETSMGLFTGKEKDQDKDFIFASVMTLGQDRYLQEAYFPKDVFDYIIVDEFHHAAAETYKKVLNYFQPKFLLGLTATPYRMDNEDILALCDDNLLFELNLPSAIHRDVLCPYQYYGIYDEIDYSAIKMNNGTYDTKELEKSYGLHQREALVYEKYQEYGGTHTLGFCVSINHAEKMAAYFREKGIVAEALHSQSTGGRSREQVQAAFRNEEVSVLFTVDMFNEGVDIKEVDTVMFLRPTESYVIFLQQLGRGLRKHEKKEKLTVLDFIGNYKRAHYKPLLLAGMNPLHVERFPKRPEEFSYPEGCQVHFDFRVLDLFKEMKKRDPKPLRLKEEYYRLKERLGRRPTRLDLYLGVDLDYKEYLKNGYLSYLLELSEMTEVETELLNTKMEQFLHRMEKTSMSRSYKIPVLKTLIAGQGRASYDQIAKDFQAYYVDHPSRGRDLDVDTTNEGWRSWPKEKFLKKALDLPIRFLSKTEGVFIVHDEERKEVRFAQDILEHCHAVVREHLVDILELREKTYFARRYFQEEENE